MPTDHPIFGRDVPDVAWRPSRSLRADARLATAAANRFGAAIDAVPGEWLARDRMDGAGDPASRGDADAYGEPDRRAELARFFEERLADRAPWLEEAERARA